MGTPSLVFWLKTSYEDIFTIMSIFWKDEKFPMAMAFPITLLFLVFLHCQAVYVRVICYCDHTFLLFSITCRSCLLEEKDPGKYLDSDRWFYCRVIGFSDHTVFVGLVFSSLTEVVIGNNHTALMVLFFYCRCCPSETKGHCIRFGFQSTVDRFILNFIHRSVHRILIIRAQEHHLLGQFSNYFHKSIYFETVYNC